MCVSRFESFPIVFGGIYGFPDQLLGLSYIGILVGSLSITPFFFAYLKYYQEPRYSASGELRPEERMPVAIFAAPIGMHHHRSSSITSVLIEAMQLPSRSSGSAGARAKTCTG